MEACTGKRGGHNRTTHGNRYRTLQNITYLVRGNRDDLGVQPAVAMDVAVLVLLVRAQFACTPPSSYKCGLDFTV